MSCVDCEKIQDRGDVAYYRLGAANVGIVGCDKHVGLVFLALMAQQREGISRHTRYNRAIVRVKGTPEKVEPIDDTWEGAGPGKGEGGDWSGQD